MRKYTYISHDNYLFVELIDKKLQSIIIRYNEKKEKNNNFLTAWIILKA
jgi:hypothetical protein